jgi:hypothetical protein
MVKGGETRFVSAQTSSANHGLLTKKEVNFFKNGLSEYHSDTRKKGESQSTLSGVDIMARN